MNDPRLWSTGETVARAMSAFRARRGERTIWAGPRRVKVRTPGERILYLPNGAHVRVSVDDSGHTTQVEETDNLHGIVRPGSIDLKLRQTPIRTTVPARAMPAAIRSMFRIPKGK